MTERIKELLWLSTFMSPWHLFAHRSSEARSENSENRLRRLPRRSGIWKARFSIGFECFRVLEGSGEEFWRIDGRIIADQRAGLPAEESSCEICAAIGRAACAPLSHGRVHLGA